MIRYHLSRWDARTLTINYLDQLGNHSFDFYIYTLLNKEHILDDFLLRYKNKKATCPNGKDMLYLGDYFETASGPHMRFRGYLNDCRNCSCIRCISTILGGQPVFGNICSNKKLDKLSLRGEAKVTAQWQLYCMVHNVEKLWRYAA